MLCVKNADTRHRPRMDSLKLPPYRHECSPRALDNLVPSSKTDTTTKRTLAFASSSLIMYSFRSDEDDTLLARQHGALKSSISDNIVHVHCSLTPKVTEKIKFPKIKKENYFSI